MKKSRFTESQIVAILKEADAARSMKEKCGAHGFPSATFYDWKSKYRGMEPPSCGAPRGSRRRTAAQAAVRRSVAREQGDERPDQLKALTPSEKCDAVAFTATESMACQCAAAAAVLGSPRRPTNGPVATQPSGTRP